jgi:integrase
VVELLDEYVRDGETRGLKPQTIFYYRQARDRYLAPALGTTRLTKLTPEHVRRLVTGLTERGLSPTTVRNTRAVLSAALQFAVRQEWIGRNPAAAVRPPRLRRPAPRPPMPEEMDRLLPAAEAAGDRLGALWTLACYAGCRPGELLALRWEDVDLDAGTVTVRRTLTKVRGSAVAFHAPKSDHGRRTLRVDRAAVDALRAHRRRQAAERVALGPDYEDNGLVFCTATGSPLLPRWAVRQFKRATARAGLPAGIRFYDLRHGNATAMLVAGVAPKAAAERLGHSSIVQFNDTYAHLLQEIDADAAAKLGAVITGRRRSVTG